MSDLNHLIGELQHQGITHPKVLNAIRQVPREKFVPPTLQYRAYDNTALPIDCEQTISQPYIVGLMSQALFQHPHPQKILEVGTGSGYQAAILAKLFKQVWTIERIQQLSLHAQKTLKELGITNVSYRCADGAEGWPEEAPFDGIIVTAAAEKIPALLLDQLDPNGGVMIIPVGQSHHVQRLTLIKRNEAHFQENILEQVCFVPLISDNK